MAEPGKFYRNPSVTIVPFKNWTGEEVIEFKATDGHNPVRKSVTVRVVPSTTTTTTPATTTSIINNITEK